jgi:hypothetical protein
MNSVSSTLDAPENDGFAGAIGCGGVDGCSTEGMMYIGGGLSDNLVGRGAGLG